MRRHDPVAVVCALCASVKQCVCCCAGPLRAAVCLQHTGRLNDARWHLQNGSYAVPTGAPALLSISMIDTSPMIPRYRDESWYNNAGGCVLGLIEAGKGGC